MTERISYSEEDRIRDLLVGRRVVKVDGDSCVLDDGTSLTILGNEGCGGCSGGHYELDHLETVDNAITSVEFTEDGEGTDQIYRVFVFADAEHINLFSVSGDDGSGYYGSGYTIHVTKPGRGRPAS